MQAAPGHAIFNPVGGGAAQTTVSYPSPFSTLSCHKKKIGDRKFWDHSNDHLNRKFFYE